MAIRVRVAFPERGCRFPLSNFLLQKICGAGRPWLAQVIVTEPPSSSLVEGLTDTVVSLGETGKTGHDVGNC